MTSKKLTEKPLKRRRFMKTAVGLTLAPIAIGLWGCGGSNSTSTSSTASNSSSSNNDTDSNAEPEEDFDGWASGGTSFQTIVYLTLLLYAVWLSQVLKRKARAIFKVTILTTSHMSKQVCR